MSTQSRARIVETARSWIGTPYQNCADLKGLGVDCGMLLRAVYAEAMSLAIPDPRPYHADQMFHKADEFIMAIVTAAGAVPLLGSPPGAGDVVLWRHGRSFSHCGIVTAWPKVIHAFARHRKVEESDASTMRILRGESRFFTLFPDDPLPTVAT